MNTVFVFGNPDLAMDALPLSLVEELHRVRPDLSFVVKDPNEDWNIPRTLLVIDTVVGIDRVTIFHGLKDFVAAPQVSVHDFDAYANMRLLEKLGKLDEVMIIGVPVGISSDNALTAILAVLPGVTQ